MDISQVRLDLLREQCFVTVSQDPLIFSNDSLRFNLDPDGSQPDEFIIEVLEQTGLWLHFAGSEMDTMDTHSILERKISSLQELSVGQCQLFAISRAILKVRAMRSAGIKPIILLDEVTSSLDHATESTIHHIIDDEFTSIGHTVIMVAHRMGGMLESMRVGRDIVVLMGDGRIEEIITDLTSRSLHMLRVQK